MLALFALTLSLAAADCREPCPTSTSTEPNLVERTCGIHGLCAGKTARDCREPGEVGPWQRPFESCRGAVGCPLRLAFYAFVFSFLWMKPKGSCDIDWGGVAWWIAFEFPTKNCPVVERPPPTPPPEKKKKTPKTEQEEAPAVAW